MIHTKFIALFQKEPLLVGAPGRVNLIGEHTDYNEGFVLPAAIDKRIICAIALREDRRCRLHALDFKEDFEFEIDHPRRLEQGWPNYLIGVVAQFQKAGYSLPGFDCLFGGDIPIGAGLSSSAALECALAVALNHLLALEIDHLQLIRYAQKAEHEYAGVQCGIMDQFASVFGREGYVVRLDCRSLEYEYFPFEMADYKIILCDSKVRHSLAGSEYNTRRRECQEGVIILKKHFPEVSSLRDVSGEMLESCRAAFPAVVHKRCQYVVEEIRRVVEACEDLKTGNLAAFGEKMYQTHEGLQHGYEVSCPELDFLVDQTRDDANVLGARMMGGGFGGCTINLVKAGAVEIFSERISAAYEKFFGKKPGIYITRISGGAGVL